MAFLSCVRWGAASVTSGRCWFHSALFFLPLHGEFFRLLWFYCDITDICEIRTVKIKNKQKSFTHTFFAKKVSTIALQISKNRYSRQVRK